MSNNKSISDTKLISNLDLKIVYFEFFVVTIIYFIIPTNLSFYLNSLFENSEPYVTGLLMALTSIAGVISGLFFNKISSLLDKWLNTLLFFGFFFALLIIGVFPNFFVLLTGLILSGFLLGVGLPYFNRKIILLSSEETRIKSISIGTSLLFLGQFVSPFLIEIITKILHLSSYTAPFLVGAILAFLLLILDYINKYFLS